MNDVILPNNSIVAIKSVPYGTYITACSDNKSVQLSHVPDPNNIPNNCRWTLRTRAQAFDSIGYLNFIGYYGKYLCTRNVDLLGLQKVVCQDNPIGPVTRLCTAGWIHDRFGATPGNCRLRMSLAGNWLSASRAGSVLVVSPFEVNCVLPEVYWKIVFIGHPQLERVHVPRGVHSDPEKVELVDPLDGELLVQQRCNKTVIRVDKVIYNYESGRNINLGGTQENGDVEAANNYVNNSK